MLVFLKLFLNNTFKIYFQNGESPLHFACKFGFPDVVEVLVGYSSTARNMRNRYGEMPLNVSVVGKH